MKYKNYPIGREKFTKNTKGRRNIKRESGHIFYVSEDDRKMPDWMIGSTIKSVDEKIEIIRRVSVIKRALISSVLDPAGGTVSGNDILNHINVLIHHPTVIFIYKQDIDGGSNDLRLQKYFDINKMAISRGGLILDQDGGCSINGREPHETIDFRSNAVFRIYDTEYYLMVFSLKIGENLPFYSVRDCDANESGISGEYIRRCLKGLLKFHSNDAIYYGESFQRKIIDRIRLIFSGSVYKEVKEGRSEVTLMKKEAESDIVVQIKKEHDRESLAKGYRVDRIYSRAAFAAETLKYMGVRDKQNYTSGEAPNLFFFARTYDRYKRRGAFFTKDRGDFSGYAHNVCYLVPDEQKAHIVKYLKWLKAIGRNGYKKLGMELYGGHENINGFKWNFKEKGYANFAISLDNYFWGLISEDKIKNDQDSSGVDILVNAFSSYIGDRSRSMVDPLFYYGPSIYRMPFRRLGGLDRLEGLMDIFDKLKNKDKFSIYDVNSHQLRNDCLRVVLFFYLTRMFGPPCENQQEYYTKIHLFPIEIGGAVVGSVGRVSYEKRLPSPHMDSVKTEIPSLPSDAASWNQEFLFYFEIVSACLKSFRQQYRDFQIEYISECFNKSFKKFLENAKLEKVNKNNAQLFLDEINSASRRIERICPYPGFNFRFLNNTIDKIDIKSIMIAKNLYLIVERSKNQQIFRSMVAEGDRQEFIENLSSLISKINKEIKNVTSVFVGNGSVEKG